MIITLKGADFSASNIGTLSSWRVSRSIGAGAVYNGPHSVDKGAPLNATVTLAEGYEIASAGVVVTMGSTILENVVSISGQVISIAISEVTGHVTIKVPTVNTNGSTDEGGGDNGDDSGGNEGTNPENLISLGVAHPGKVLDSGAYTIKDGGATYTVYAEIPITAGGIYEFANCYRSWWLKADKTGLETFNPKTSLVTAPANAAYVSVTTEAATPSIIERYNPNIPVTGENIVSQGTVTDNKALVTDSYSMTTNEDYFVVDKIPVEAGSLYAISPGIARIWWLKSDKTGLSTENAISAKVLTAPESAAYISITVQKSKHTDISTVSMVKII